MNNDASSRVSNFVVVLYLSATICSFQIRPKSQFSERDIALVRFCWKTIFLRRKKIEKYYVCKRGNCHTDWLNQIFITAIGTVWIAQKILLGNKNVDTAKDIFEVYKRGR